MDAFTQRPGTLRPRDPNKFASTNITNEIVDALNGGFATGMVPTRDVFARMFYCQLTGVPDEAGDDSVFTCRAYAMNGASGATVDSLGAVAALGDVVFDDAIFVNLARSTVDEDSADAGNIGCDARLIGYTGEDPPRPIFIGIAIATQDCGSDPGTDGGTP